MIQNEDKPENSVLPFLISPLTKTLSKSKYKLIRKRRKLVHKKISDVKIKRQLFDRYLKNICSLLSQYGI